MYFLQYLLFTLLCVFLLIYFNRNIFISYIPFMIAFYNYERVSLSNISFGNLLLFNIDDKLSLVYIFTFLTLLPISIYYTKIFNNKITKPELYLICFAVFNGLIISISYNFFTLFIFYEILSVLSLFLMNYNKLLIEPTKDYILYAIIPSTFLIFIIIFDYENTLLPFNKAEFSKYELIFIMIFTAKASILPSSRWIISAMKAPHYISALFHSCLVVKSGLIFILRCLTNYNHEYHLTKFKILDLFWNSSIFFTPIITIIVFSLYAMAINHYKTILASSTIINVSQMILLNQKENILLYYIIFHALFKFTLFGHLGYIYLKTNIYNNFYLKNPNIYESTISYISVVGCFFLSGHIFLNGLNIKKNALDFLDYKLYFIICFMSFVYNNKIIKAILQERATIMFITFLTLFIINGLFEYAIIFFIAYTIIDYIQHKWITLVSFSCIILNEIL